MKTKNKEFYVYAHTRNDTGDIFYIGKGHGTRATRFSGRNRHWTGIARKHGFCVVILESNLEEIECYQREEFFIEKYKAEGASLVNLNNGGRNVMSGMKHTDEARKKISLSSKGRTISKETRKKLSKIARGRIIAPEKIKRGKDSPFYGRKLTQEHRKRISDALKGKMPKFLPDNKGRKHSLENIEKNRVSQIGKKLSKETKEKISMSMKILREKQRNEPKCIVFV